MMKLADTNLRASKTYNVRVKQSYRNGHLPRHGGVNDKTSGWVDQESAENLKFTIYSVNKEGIALNFHACETIHQRDQNQ